MKGALAFLFAACVTTPIQGDDWQTKQDVLDAMAKSYCNEAVILRPLDADVPTICCFFAHGNEGLLACVDSEGNFRNNFWNIPKDQEPTNYDEWFRQ